MGSIYHNIFKEDAPTFSTQANELHSTMGDWYVGEYFSYIRIWGRNIAHSFSRIVLNRMVLEEISFKTVIDGVFPKLIGAKRKGGICFSLTLDI